MICQILVLKLIIILINNINKLNKKNNLIKIQKSVILKLKRRKNQKYYVENWLFINTKKNRNNQNQVKNLSTNYKNN